MAIVVLPIGDITGGAPYSAIDAARISSDAEKSMLLMVEAMHTYMSALADEREARMFHYAMSRMLAGVSYSAGTYNGASLVTPTDVADIARDDAIAHYSRGANPTDI
jgi:hypothetical protein